MVLSRAFYYLNINELLSFSPRGLKIRLFFTDFYKNKGFLAKAVQFFSFLLLTNGGVYDIMCSTMPIFKRISVNFFGGNMDADADCCNPNTFYIE